jgi:chaperonin GroES
MKVVPIGDKILIERVQSKDRTEGGIVIPDSAKEKPKRGEVVALGDGRELESGETAGFQVQEGDEVLFESYAGTEVTFDGREYLLMSEEDLLGIIQ